MEYIKYKIFQEYKDILCYTTTKDISKPLLGSFAMHTGEDINLVRENRKDLESLFPPNASFVSIYQIHSDKILDIKKKQDINWQSLDKSIEADAIITQLADKGVVVIGISGGGVVLGPDITIVEYFDQESNIVNLKDLIALNITDIVMYPHYKKEDEGELKKFESQYGCKVKRLSDNRTIVISNEELKE